MACTQLSGELPYCYGSILLGCGPTPQVQSDRSLEAGLVSYLSTSPVACLIGNRYYPGAVARANTTWPVVVYSRSSTDHAHGLYGSLGWASAEFELDVWSTSYADTVAVATALRGALQGFKGWMGCVSVGAVLLTGETDSIEKPGDGSGQWYYSRQLDFSFLFGETVPKF